MSDVGMVIVGAGEAGARAASALREQGYDGPVTLVGDEPHGPYERPPLSKAVMTAGAVTLPPFILDENKLAAQSIAHISHVRATSLDPTAHTLALDNGDTLAYAKLLIATGAGLRKLPTPGESTLYFHLADDGRLVGVSGIGQNSLIARDIRLAEMMIARQTRPDPVQLASADVRLKSLL